MRTLRRINTRLFTAASTTSKPAACPTPTQGIYRRFFSGAEMRCAWKRATRSWGCSDSAYEEGVVELLPGDVFAAFTDGVTEPEDAHGEQFGDERLIELLIQNS